mgnify:CR=1 FL=1
MKFKNDIELQAGLEDLSGSTGTLGQLLSSTETGTSWIAQDNIIAAASKLVVIACKNTHTATILKGTPVYQTGTVGATDVIEVAPADALISLGHQPAVGLLQQDLAINEFGNVVITGELLNFTTDPIDGLTPVTGDKVFVKSGGGLTLTKPTGEGNGIQNMGLVGKVSGGNSGSITVSSIMRTNDVPNLPEGRIWIGDGNTIVSDTVYVDEPNNNVGIGTDSPDPNYKLDVNGDILASKGRFEGFGVSWGSFTGGVQGAQLENWPGSRSVIRSEEPQMQFYMGRATTGVGIAMVLTDTGNVGIGTTSPGAKLDVASGDIRLATNATYIKITDNNGAPNRVLGINSSNTTYIGPIDSYQGGGIVYGASANVQYHGFYGGGSEKVRITSSGNVGIGTTTPGTKLVIQGTNDAAGAGVVEIKTTGTKLKIGGNTTYSWIQSYESKPLYINQLGNNVILNLGGGRVGIGTDSPRTKLHVTGLTGDDDPALGFSTAPFFVSNTSNSYGLNIGVDTNGASWLQSQSNTSSIAYKLLLNPLGGNVGIGTTSPNTALEVDGAISTTTSDYVQGSTGSRLLIETSGSGNTHSYIQAQNSGGTSSNEDLALQLYGGNVGIGTSSPGSKLHVSSGSGANGDCVLLIEADTDNAVETSNAILRLSQDGGGVTGALSLTANNEMTLYNEYAGKLFLGVGNSAKMTIDTNGNVGIGTTSPTSAKLQITVPSYTYGCQMDGPSGSSFGYMYFTSAGSYRGAISPTSTGVNYASASDYRLKENVIKLQNSTERLKKLKPSNFNFLEDPSETVDGFIAHELQEVVPGAVTGKKDAVGFDGKPNYQGVDQSKIVPLLTAALQEAISKIEQLETRIQILENK